ncbi:MAG: OadG family protein [Spirochaetaceae bacterium]|nr:OadG family protein [Spirochaetaceae bacterium]
MSPEAPSTLVVAVLGMGVVFVFLVFLSAMMAALTSASGRRNTSQDAREEPGGAGGPGWIAAATAAYLAAERDAEQTAAGMPSAAAWRPYDTVEAARWRLRMPASTTVARQVAP